MEGPRFFVDRSLGRLRVPALLRDAGWTLTTLAEHYGIPADERVADVDWLVLAGRHRWPVLMKDERIRYRRAETAAVVEHAVRAFYLTSGNLTAQQMADLFITHRDAIWAQAIAPGDALFAVDRRGVRPIPLDD